jgi:hypothetical protein
MKKTAVAAALVLAAAAPVYGADTLKLSRVVKVGGDDIGGVVSGPKGPEAGVWVIAQTKDTPTQYTKIVVTDDKGRYLIPDLPEGKYQV